jgi:hypothetical protein
MSKQVLWALGAVTLWALTGCNKAESPATVQNDVARASDSAAGKDAKAAEKQADTEAAANKDVGSAQEKADAQTTSAADEGRASLTGKPSPASTLVCREASWTRMRALRGRSLYCA